MPVLTYNAEYVVNITAPQWCTPSCFLQSHFISTTMRYVGVWSIFFLVLTPLPRSLPASCMYNTVGGNVFGANYHMTVVLKRSFRHDCNNHVKMSPWVYTPNFLCGYQQVFSPDIEMGLDDQADFQGHLTLPAAWPDRGILIRRYTCQRMYLIFFFVVIHSISFRSEYRFYV